MIAVLADVARDRVLRAVRTANPVRRGGIVVRVVGLTIESTGPQAAVGDVCVIRSADPRTLGRMRETPAEVVGFKEGRTLLMPLGEMSGVSPGDTIIATGKPITVPVGRALLGRILDGLGRPIDDGPPLAGCEEVSVFREPPDPVRRPRISDVLSLGVRAVDGLLTVGRGQRVGIFAGSGVGKSTLLGMMARYTAADVVVVGLIGERGREVRDFIEKDLGEAGLKKSVIVVSTSDQPPLVCARAAYSATAIAEHFRDQGLDVLLLMDSVTRYCRALRNVALSVGEPPGLRSFPPSVFSTLPKLLERAGTAERGSITGLYTVLVDADDMNEPVADNVRGIIDGHIVLARNLADRNHYPAIDILGSISRLMTDIVDRKQNDAAGKVKELIAVYRDAEDLIRIGAYVDGADPRIDEAKKRVAAIDAFLRQRVEEPSTLEATVKALAQVIA
jgi:flagellum-specific ATP synthase